jgi:hypothetical protein
LFERVLDEAHCEGTVARELYLQVLCLGVTVTRYIILEKTVAISDKPELFPIKREIF